MTPDDATDISDYLLGELAGEDRIRIERRMRMDAAFRDEVDRLVPVRDQLLSLPASAWRPDAGACIRHPARRPGASALGSLPEDESRASPLGALLGSRPRAIAAAICGAVLVMLRAASRARRA